MAGSARGATSDVIVIGGGPAGSAAATALAREGWRALLLDRARFPRDKPCGDFLTPGAVDALRRLGVWPAALSAGALPLERVEIHAPGGGCASHAPTGGPAGWSLRRRELDAILLDQARSAGVTVREGVAVRGLVWRDGAVVGVRTDAGPIAARLIVGADGARSLVARELGVVRPLPGLQRIALVSHWQEADGRSAIEMRAARRAVCGFGPLAAGANVTLVVPHSQAPRIAGRAAEFVDGLLGARFARLAERLPSDGREERILTVGCFGHVCRRASGAGALLVGDAAAFVDPFTGEGVYFALRGAELAARTAHEALGADNLSAERLAAYDTARAELTARYALCAIVQTVVRTPRLMDLLVRRLGRSQALMDRLMGALADVKEPSTVLRASFALRLVTG